jgi:hypothetical protein
MMPGQVRARLRTASGAWLRCSLVAGLALGACVHAGSLETHVHELQAVARQARTRGAYRCAPEELAEAESQLEFAARELQEGDPPRAREHLIIARANAYAALRLSTPGCTSSVQRRARVSARASGGALRPYAPAPVRSEPTMITAQHPLPRGSTKEHAAI